MDQKGQAVMDHRLCLHPRNIPCVDESKRTNCNGSQAIVTVKTCNALLNQKGLVINDH